VHAPALLVSPLQQDQPETNITHYVLYLHGPQMAPKT
jgi:hypothetical protein